MTKSRLSAVTIPLVLVSTLALAGCGTTNNATSSSGSSGSSNNSTTNTTTSTTKSTSAAGSAKVYAIKANVTAQMVMVGKTATFVVTALSKNGQPVPNKPVKFYIGPMVPLSNVPPSHWLASGTSAAAPFISNYSKTTNQKGQATLILKSQPAKTMEMVGVSIGNLSSYSAKAHHAVGSLDAWWTTPKTMPTAPVGDSVTVNPFITVASSSTSIPVTVTVDSPSGPISGASVLFSAKSSSSKGSSSNAMGMSSSMSSSNGTTVMTNASGEATYKAMTGASKSMLPIRIVVTHGSAKTRVAGGMNIELITK